MAHSQAARRAHFTAEPAPVVRPERPVRTARPAPTPGTSAAARRRRRARHYRLRRRDLVEDLGAGLLLAVLLFLATAGLGVLALLEIPLVGILVAAGVLDRRRRSRRFRGRPRPPRARPDRP
jgi:hypothetical protein